MTITRSIGLAGLKSCANSTPPSNFSIKHPNGGSIPDEITHDLIIDTNIFLEILLTQKRWKACEDLLRQYRGKSAFTDFALHSIGVALLGQQKAMLFQAFLNDVLVRNDLLALPSSEYPLLLSIHERHRLGFDDAYQLAVAEHFGLEFITIDRHFRGIDSPIKITILE